MRHFINLVEVGLPLMENYTRYFGGFEREPERNDTNRYMGGWCAYFALALHDLYGFDIIGTSDHIAAKSGDRYIDVRGSMTEEQFRNGLSGEVIPRTREDLFADLENGHYECGFFEQRELDRAKRIVRKLMR